MPGKLKLHPDNFLGFKTGISAAFTILFYAGGLSMVIYLLFHVPLYAIGDEKYYISYAKDISRNGLYTEMAKGNPLGYTLILLLVSKAGISLLTAGYLISLVSTAAMYAGLLYIGYHYLGLRAAWLHLASVTILLGFLSGNHICICSDDMYYSAFIIWALVLLAWALARNKPPAYIALAGLLIGLSLIIRPLALMYFASVMAALAIISLFNGKSLGRNIKQWVVLAAGFGAGFLIVQYPALHVTGRPAYENKIADSFHTQANWVQKNTLTNMLKESGGPLEDDHTQASWKQCDDYLVLHGPNSLPRSPLMRILRDPVHSARYAAIGAAKVVYTFFRYVGLAFLVPVLFLFYKRRRQNLYYSFLTLTIISYIALYIAQSLNIFENRHIIIPHLVLSLLGIAWLKKLDDEGDTRAGKLGMLQLAALLLIMLLDMKFFFLHHPGGVFYN